MKIGIIGGGDGFAAVLAAELAKRCLPEEVEVVVVGSNEVEAPHAITVERIQELGLLFSSVCEQPIFPITLPEVMPWPDTIKPHRNRYNRKGKWRQNQSGSKYF